MADALPPLLTVDTLAGPDAADGVVIRADLLPPSTHGSNLRGILDSRDWDRLRIPVCERANNACAICGAATMRSGRPSRPDCHEKWVFERVGRFPVQRLEQLVALCPGCHEVQHSGRARVRGREQNVLNRLMRLNHWTQEQADADLERAVRRARALAAFSWNLDLTALEGQITIPGFPALLVKASARATLGNSLR